jgi:uncharacterized protein (DUF2147 family)
MKTIHKLFVIIFVLFAYCFSNEVFAQTGGDALVGLWLPSNGKARVQIYKRGEKYFGRIVWLKEPNDPATGKPKVDKNNPNESWRNTPLLGYSMLKDFSFKGENKWEDGTIYDPESGSTYSCKIDMTDSNTLDVKGFIGVAIFGRTDTWKRLQMK